MGISDEIKTEKKCYELIASLTKEKYIYRKKYKYYLSIWYFQFKIKQAIVELTTHQTTRFVHLSSFIHCSDSSCLIPYTFKTFFTVILVFTLHQLYIATTPLLETHDSYTIGLRSLFLDYYKWNYAFSADFCNQANFSTIIYILYSLRQKLVSDFFHLVVGLLHM